MKIIHSVPKSCPTSLPDPKLAYFEVLDPDPHQNRIDESFVSAALCRNELIVLNKEMQ
jgi:hypothetical protein